MSDWLARWGPTVLGSGTLVVMLLLGARQRRRLLAREMRLYVMLLTEASRDVEGCEALYGPDYLPWIHRLITRARRRLRWCGGPLRPAEIDRARRDVEREAAAAKAGADAAIARHVAQRVIKRAGPT